MERLIELTNEASVATMLSNLCLLMLYKDIKLGNRMLITRDAINVDYCAYMSEQKIATIKKILDNLK